MNRLSMALCFAASFAALGIAFLQSRSGDPMVTTGELQGLHELRALVETLQEKVTALEAGRSKRVWGGVGARNKAAKPGSAAPVPSDKEPAGDREEIAALTERLARLEDDTTIAKLVQSGKTKLLEDELTGALDTFGDPKASPEQKFRAFGSLRRMRKSRHRLLASAMEERGVTERDVVLPIVELAQDTTLDGDFRAEVVHSLAGSKVEEMRQPLLDLLALDDVPEVRGASLLPLMWHLDDPAVREAITRASQEESNEQVRARAQELMPKVDWVASHEAEGSSNQTESAGEK